MASQSGKPGPGRRPGRRRRSGGGSGGSGEDGLIYGVHAVAAAWANPARRCRRLWATQSAWQHLQEMTGEPPADRPDPKIVERAGLDRLVSAGAVHQGLVLEAEPLAQRPLGDVVATLSPDDPALIVLLDQVTDPHNVGAILRSAAVFGAAAVALPERNAPGPSGTLAKAASGAVDLVPLVRITNLARTLRQLQERGFACIGLAEEAAEPIGAVESVERVALVLGAEGSGLRRLTRETCDRLVSLPSGGPLASLNVSNAAAVALYALSSASCSRK